MSLNEEIFAIKLYEMEQQYARLQSRLQACGRGDRETIREELRKAKNEYRERLFLLQKNVDGSRTKAVSELARAQLEYGRKMERLSEENLEEALRLGEGDPAEDKAEAAALYAEYAIDLATQCMQYALIAALTAMDLQLSTEEGDH